MEGVVEKGKVLGDFEERWKVLRSSSVHGTVQKSERWLEGLILDKAKNHTIATRWPSTPHMDMAGISCVQLPLTLHSLGGLSCMAMLQA
jgi:hypothetical protein